MERSCGCHMHRLHQSHRYDCCWVHIHVVKENNQNVKVIRRYITKQCRTQYLRVAPDLEALEEVESVAEMGLQVAQLEVSTLLPREATPARVLKPETEDARAFRLPLLQRNSSHTCYIQDQRVV